jgi:superfamily II DNA/RNA helicase
VVVLSPTREAAQQIAEVMGRIVAGMPEQGMKVGIFI